MKSFIILTALLLTAILSFGQSNPQHKQVVKVIKTFPLWHSVGNYAVPSTEQIKTTDSLKKLGFKGVDIYRVMGTRNVKVLFIKY